MKKRIPSFEYMPPAEFGVSGTDIHLRLFRQGDEDNLLKLVNDEPVQRFVPWAKRVTDKTSTADIIQSFEKAWQRGVMARYVIERGGEFAGYAGLWSDKKPNFYEFGFAILPEFRGQGVGTSTTRKLFEIVKEQMNAIGVVAYVNDENLASQAVVKKHNFLKLDEFDDNDRRYELIF